MKLFLELIKLISVFSIISGGFLNAQEDDNNSKCELIQYLIKEIISFGEMKKFPNSLLLTATSCYEGVDLDSFLAEAIVLRLRHDSKTLVPMDYLNYEGEVNLWKSMSSCCFGAVKLIIKDDIEYQIDLGSIAARDAYEIIYGEIYTAK